jgi:TMEM175 potassium channel family protein
MTILALQVHAPDVRAIHSEADLVAALVRLEPRAATYVMSFITLGIYWVAQQTQHHLMAHSDRNAAWLNLAFLLVVVFLPFSTALLTEFITYRTALLFYWLNIVLLGATFLIAWNYAVRAGLLKAHVDAQMISAIRRRVVVSQSLYAFGAALCVFGTAWSIGFIFLVQLNYAVAPPIRWLRRLTT